MFLCRQRWSFSRRNCRAWVGWTKPGRNSDPPNEQWTSPGRLDRSPQWLELEKANQHGYVYLSMMQKIWIIISDVAATLSNEIVHDRKVLAQKREQFLSLAVTFADRVPILMESRRPKPPYLRGIQIEGSNVYIAIDVQKVWFFLIEIVSYAYCCSIPVPTQVKLFQVLLDSEKPIQVTNSSNHRSLAVTVLNEALYNEHQQCVQLCYGFIQ